MKLTGGSLFTGSGGLDLAVAWLFHDLGIDLRFVWDSDIKPAAMTLLAHRRPHAPNLGDIHDIATPLVDTPPVDVLTFGWPCQPHSAAGKRLGEADPRALWPQVARVIATLRPQYLFGENVARVAGNGELRRVVRTLAEVGYVGAWRCVRASDVGAPHRRDRLFLVGVRADVSGPSGSDQGVAGDHGPERSAGTGELTLLPSPTARLGASGSVTPAAAAARAARRPNGPNLDDAIALLPTPNARDIKGGNGERTGMPRPDGRTRGPGDVNLPTAIELLPTPAVADARNTRNATAERTPENDRHHSGWTLSDVAHADRWGKYAAAIQRWERLTRPAPDPTAPLGKGGEMRLAPVFVEWMMGLPAGWVTEAPGLTRAQQLSMLGDGVVPQQARYAYGLLLTDLAVSAERAA